MSSASRAAMASMRLAMPACAARAISCISAAVIAAMPPWPLPVLRCGCPPPTCATGPLVATTSNAFAACAPRAFLGSASRFAFAALRAAAFAAAASAFAAALAAALAAAASLAAAMPTRFFTSGL